MIVCMMAAASSTGQSWAPAPPGVRELFEALSTRLSDAETAVLGFVGIRDSRESASLIEALGAVTAQATGSAVLVVTAASPTRVGWELYGATADLGDDLSLLGTIEAQGPSTSRALRETLRVYRDSIAGSRDGTGLALMTVPRDGFGGETQRWLSPFQRLLRAATAVFDAVLVDLPATAESAHSLLGGTVVVVPPDADVAAVSAVAERVTRHGGTVLGVVVNVGFQHLEARREETRRAPTGPTRVSVPARGVATALVIAVAGATALWQVSSRFDLGSQASRNLGPLSSTRLIASSGLVTAPVIRGSAPVLEFTAQPPRVADPPRAWAFDPPTRSTDEVARVGMDGVTEPERLEEFATRPSVTSTPGQGPVDAVVSLSAVVRADGTVDDVRLIQLTGGPADVVEPAIEAVKQWRYRPAMRDGEPVDVHISVLVDFRGS